MSTRASTASRSCRGSSGCRQVERWPEERSPSASASRPARLCAPLRGRSRETPLQLYGELFVDVQLQRVFEDGKTFADAVPNDDPATILRRYREERLRRPLRSGGVRGAQFRPAAPAGLDLSRGARSGCVRPYRRALAGARAPARARSSLRLAAAAALSLCRAGRALHRDLLLGLLFHHAGPGAERAARPRPRHGAQLRQPDRPLRPRAERQPHLLSQPLAAALLRRDGRPGREHG